MDSLTQIALGAAVGEAVLGRRVGRKAAVWGALCGTLPDLDVFVPLGDAVRDFTYHRGASHSLFVLAALTPLIAWLMRRVHPDARDYRFGVPAMIYLVFLTHVLLDSFTVYGTQIFWPFVTTPMTWSTIFIIDPAYTMPLAIGVLVAVVAHRSSWAYRANLAGLALSTLYLGWSLGAKLYVHHVAEESLAAQGVAAERLLSTPTPFNTVLWRFVAMTGTGDYYEGYYSLLEDAADVRWERHDSANELLQPLTDSWAVQRLQWFTKGFYRVDRKGDAIVMTDLRMGLEPDYVFRFRVGEIGNPHATPVARSVRVRTERSWEALDWLAARLNGPAAASWASWKHQEG
ncbi:MAG: metal-dependent hydrolase [Gammaproteobacteria bacterium]